MSRIGQAALGLVVVQATAHALVMRLTRMPGHEPYLASTAVVLMELIKLVVCTLVVLGTESKPIATLWEKTVVEWQQTLKVGVPALCYVIQNNLIFVAATELDAPVFQVLYQFKLITTAFFSVLILNRSLTRQQWGAIGILAVGVMIVQTSSSSPLSGSSEVEAKPISTKGMMAVGSACMLSGFAGVWFEMLLKQTGKHAASLWVRNVQLATFSLPLALGKLWLADRETVQELGFFSGYTSLVFLTIFMGSAGGLIVAVVVKYADNILKGFAASISAVVVTVISMLVPAFKFVPEPTFFVGGAVVFVAAYVYGTASTAAAAAAAKKLPTVTIREASVSPNPQ